MPTCALPSVGDHKKNFDKAVKELTDLRKKLLKAESPSEISQLEREVRKSLMAVVHYANLLGFWMKSAADQRRKEIRDKE